MILGPLLTLLDLPVLFLLQGHLNQLFAPDLALCCLALQASLQHIREPLAMMQERIKSDR